MMKSQRNKKTSGALRGLAVATVASALILGPSLGAQAADGWSPPECKDKVQTVIIPGITTTVWYPAGGWYSAGHGGYKFKYKAIFYIAGKASQTLVGTTYCSL